MKEALDNVIALDTFVPDVYCNMKIRLYAVKNTPALTGFRILGLLRNDCIMRPGLTNSEEGIRIHDYRIS